MAERPGIDPPEPAAKAVEDPFARLQRLDAHAFIGSDDLLADDDEPVVWIWDGVVQERDHVELSGPSYSGKTTASLLLAIAAANPGEPIELFGRVVTPMAPGKYVLLVTLENSVRSIKRKLRESCEMLGLPLRETLDRVIVIARGAPVLATFILGAMDRESENVWVDCIALAKRGHVGLTVLDSRARVLRVEDSNSEEHAVAAQRAIIQMTENSGAPVVVVSHTRKANGQRGELTIEDVSGSGQRAAGADVVIIATADRNPDGSIAATKLVVAKRRDDGGEEHPEPMVFAVRHDVDGRPHLAAEGAPRPEDAPVTERVLALLKRDGTLGKPEIRKRLGLSGAMLEKALDALFLERRIDRVEEMVRGVKRPRFSARLTDAELGFTTNGALP